MLAVQNLSWERLLDFSRSVLPEMSGWQRDHGKAQGKRR